jgi:hypothetical protein
LTVNASGALDTGVRYIGNPPSSTSGYFAGGAQIPSTIETTVNTQIISPSVTLAGLQATAYLPALIYVSPAFGSFTISINGGAFSSAEQAVVNGDTIRVRLTTSATYAASGSVSVSFRTASGGADNYLLSFAYQNQNNDRAPQTFQVGAARAYTQLSTVLPLLRAGDIVELDSGDYGPTASNGTLSSVGNTVEYTLAGETSINFPIIAVSGLGTITFEQFVGGSWTNLAVSDATTASTLVRTGTDIWTVRAPYAYAAAYTGATKVRMRLSASTSGSFKVAVGKYYYELSPHTVTRPGTSALPITIRAAAGAATRPVLHNGSLLDGTPGCNFYSIWFRACNVKLEGLEIRADRAASAVATGAGSAFNPAHNITLTDCILRDSADGLIGLDSGTGSVTLDRCWIVNCGDANPENGFYKHGTYYGCSLDAFPEAVFTVNNCVYLNNEGNSIKCRGPANIRDNWIHVPNNPYSYYCIELPGLQGYNTESSHINYADVTGNVLISQSTNMIRGGGDGASARSNAQVRYYKNTALMSGSFLNLMRIQDGFYSFLFSSNAVIGASGNALASMTLVAEQSATTWAAGIRIRLENDNFPAGYTVSNNASWVTATELSSNVSGGTVANNTFAAFDATPSGALVGAGVSPPSTLPAGFELPSGVYRTDFSTRVWTTQPTLYSVLTVPSRSSLTNIGAI